MGIIKIVVVQDMRESLACKCTRFLSLGHTTISCMTTNCLAQVGRHRAVKHIANCPYQLHLIW